MKKTLMIFGICMIVAGIGVAGVGLLLGGTLSFTYVVGKGLYTDNDQLYSMKTEIFEGFEKIELDLESIDCDVEVAVGDGYSVAYPKGGEDECADVDCQVKNGVLKVTARGQRTGFMIDFSFLSKQEKTIRVTVPDQIMLKEVSAKVDAGDLKLENISADSMLITMDYGDLLLQECKSQQVSIENKAGQISLKTVEFDGVECSDDYGLISIWNSSFSKACFTLSCGDLDMSNVTADEMDFSLDYGSMEAKKVDTNNLKVTMSSGDLKLSLLKPMDEYSLDISAACGDLKLNGRNDDLMGRYKYENKNTDNKLQIESKYGDVDIDFEK